MFPRKREADDSLDDKDHDDLDDLNAADFDRFDADDLAGRLPHAGDDEPQH